METILRNISRRKIEEALGSLSAGFAAPLLVLDSQGKVLMGAGTNCLDRETFNSSAGRNGKMLCSEPLFFNEKRVGTLEMCLESGMGTAVAPGIARSLESFLGLEGEMVNLSSEIVRVYDELSLIQKISGMLGNEMDIERICRLVLDEAEKILSVTTIFIMLLDVERQELYTRFAIGRDGQLLRGYRIPSNQGLVGHVFNQREPVTVCDITIDGRLWLPYPAKSVLCVPLIADTKPVGMVIATDKSSGEEFWSQELQLMGIFAAEVSSAIQKANLYAEINTLFLSTVEALATAIEAKDPYTYGHSRRVAELSVAISSELGMPKNRIRKLELAALLHDIGKIGTPESILRKPEMLQPEEYEKIKEHPAKGAEILSMITEFKEIVTWIRHHHEWYDGKGYPDCLAEEQIPIEARILSVADSYDAMTSDRPYRIGMPSDTVLKIMEQFSRSQFDPAILAAFERCLQQEISSSTVDVSWVENCFSPVPA
ncbi:MAG: HD domain-containing protein [Syntrophobacterales bacterium]|nr:MAG: HD domain-containing protein [Syntrophobacterales bacterium]